MSFPNLERVLHLIYFSLEKGAKRALRTSTIAYEGTGDALSSRRGRSLRPGFKAKKHNKVDLTERDREQVYNPPGTCKLGAIKIQWLMN